MINLLKNKNKKILDNIFFIRYYKNIQLIDCKEDYEDICEILNKTDNDILKNIDRIIVHNTNYIPKESIVEEKNKNDITLGTAVPVIINKNSIKDVIRIVSSKSIYYNNIYIQSFKLILNHEIGHVKGRINNLDSEQYAINYANQHTINKGQC